MKELDIVLDQDGTVTENCANTIKPLYPSGNEGTDEKQLLSGRVTDQTTGEGIRDVDIFAYEGKTAAGTPVRTKTDSRGYYDLELAAGTYTIAAEKEDYVSAEVQAKVKEGEAVSYANLSMKEKPKILSGKILDEETGEGIRDASIRLYTKKENALAVQGTSGSDGTYSLEIEKGDYKIVIEKSGYYTGEFELTIKEDLSRDFSLREKTKILSGRVYNDMTGAGVSGAAITVYPAGSGSAVQQISSGSDGSYSVELERGSYTIVVEKSGYETGSFETEVTQDLSLDLPLTEEGVTLSGRVVDAATANGVSGAVLTFYPTGSTGSAVQCESDADGSWAIRVGKGTYSVSVEKEGYITGSFDVSAKEDSSMNFTITEELGEDVIRIVLTWGTTPRDLDSYLRGTTGDGNDAFVKFSRRSTYMRSGEVAAELDVDCRNGYGPETITIYDMEGSYEFYVVDYTVSESMAEYGATAQIYKGNALVAEVNVASDVVNVWGVAEIRNGEVYVTNEALNITLTPASK